MQMRMVKQVLSPTVLYGEKADLCAQMFGIGSNGGRGLGSGSEQNAVDEIFVLVSDGSDLFGNREDDMKIVCVENFGLSFFNPTCRLNAKGVSGENLSGLGVKLLQPVALWADERTYRNHLDTFIDWLRI
jgi:hypothetical protein